MSGGGRHSGDSTPTQPIGIPSLEVIFRRSETPSIGSCNRRCFYAPFAITIISYCRFYRYDNVVIYKNRGYCCTTRAMTGCLFAASSWLYAEEITSPRFRLLYYNSASPFDFYPCVRIRSRKTSGIGMSLPYLYPIDAYLCVCVELMLTPSVFCDGVVIR